jgi:hypothetical protein
VTYRDDAAALHAYHDSLVQELAGLDAQLAGLGQTLAARERVAAELARVRALLVASSPRLQPVRLGKLKVASPCRESWSDMTGDDQVRHCKRCDKDVFNLSEMNAADAEALLARHGTAPCVRFFRRADGTVKTKDCPDRRPLIAGVIAAGAIAAAGLAAAGVSALATMGAPADRPAIQLTPEPPPPLPPMPVMGGIAMPEPPPMIMGEMMVEMGDVAAPAPEPEVEPQVEPEVEIKGKPSR